MTRATIRRAWLKAARNNLPAALQEIKEIICRSIRQPTRNVLRSPPMMLTGVEDESFHDLIHQVVVLMSS
ncbi:hypothetical protein RvY_06921 [Ramazzottius varieornatus]|uniref:Uncharacterized protein n=1 Tax=Ramazzottius varieornatus TaxID=947166 RepID=A0A1D1V3I7_RAMVA|nr:hypothetical protein RvY_06921 [Ramazzottius varieornatus]